ncbi:hypothetical protein M1512_02975 [Patescibacteria group bacterium]|jgi:F0F1-type ATP synthase membrane subunit b/b'|nr:hypothetical protein [Patescibacteria group bacterium]
MTFWWLVVILITLGAVGVALVWLIAKLSQIGATNTKRNVNQIIDAANNDVEHIFNDQFREELRNRGRLHFERIIGENAMFLQQDLRLTTSELNEYLKQELGKSLREEFAKYEQSITDAKQMAIDSIEKTKQTIEEQRAELSQKLNEEVEAEKQRSINRFEANMADIINHYVLAAIGQQIDLSDQMEYILSELEANKQAISEDIRHGA